MKKILLLMFGLLFTGAFAFAGTGGMGGDKMGAECKSSIDGGDLFAPSEILEAKGTTKEAETPMYSKRGNDWNSLNIDGVISLAPDIAPCLAPCFDKKRDVGWQGYTDA